MTSRKKWLVAAAGVLAGALALLLLVPVFFKGPIEARARARLDRTVAARIDWRGLGLSFFRDFPELTLSIDHLTAVGRDRFAGDTIASIGSARLVLDMGSVLRAWRGRGPIVVRSIRLDDPTLRLQTFQDGTSNWDLLSRPAQDSGSAGHEAAGSASTGRAFDVALSSFEVHGGDLAIRNEQAGLAASVKGLDYDLSGRFSQKRFAVRSQARASAATVELAGVPYLKDVALDFNATVDADMAAKRFTFRDDELRLNDLALRFSGDAAQRPDGIGLDLTFTAPRTGFGQVLSLIPSIYAHDFASLQTSGTFTVQGSVKGTYGEGSVPSFALKADVANGMFRYPDLPLPARDIGAALSIDNPGGTLDSTVVRLERFHMVIGDQPLDAALTLRTPVSDPSVDARVDGTLDLGALAKTVKLQGVEDLSGAVSANASVRARKSDVDSARYERVAARGTVTAHEVHVVALGLRQPVTIQNAKLDLTPSRADLKAFDALLGSSDVKAAGSVDNILGFVMHGEPLHGDATFRSRRLALGEWRSDEPGREVIPVPAWLDLSLQGSVDTLTLDSLTMLDAKGRMEVHDQRLTLNDFTLRTLGGRVGLQGWYQTTDPVRPTFDMGLKIDSMDVAKASSAFLTVRTLAPISRFAHGTFSTDVSLTGALGQDMTPVFDSLDGKGSLSTSRIALEGFPMLRKLSDALKIPSLSSPTLDAVRSSLEIRDGRVHVRPFRVGIGGMRMAVEGSNGIDQSLDYTLGLSVPSRALGAAAEQAMQSLAARVGASEAELRAADSVHVDVGVKGTVMSPTLDIGLGKAAASVTHQAGEAAKAAVQSNLAGEREKADSAATEARRRARARADSMVAAAERQADGIRADARKLADQVRAEGDRSAQAVLDKATNPIARRAAQPVADRIRKEADQKADGIVSQADQRADSLVAKARATANDLVEGAGGGG